MADSPSLVFVLATYPHWMMESHEQERLVFVTTTHWFKYVPRALFCHFLAFVSLLLFWISSVTISVSALVTVSTFLIAFTLFLLAHHFWFHKVLSEEMFDIFLTNSRIIYFNDCLFLCDNEHEIPLHRIAAVEVKQEGLLQNLLNFGTLWIDTGGGTIDLKRSIPLVPKPEELCERITVLTKDND